VNTSENLLVSSTACSLKFCVSPKLKKIGKVRAFSVTTFQRYADEIHHPQTTKLEFLTNCYDSHARSRYGSGKLRQWWCSV